MYCKNKFMFVTVVALAAVSVTANAALKVAELPNGSFDIMRDGVAVAKGFRPILEHELPSQRSFAVTKDGSRVWNIWCETAEDNFRFEIAERSDGAVEISILSHCAEQATSRRRALSFTMPRDVFDGARCDYKIKHRLYPTNYKCILNQDMKPFETRYFAAAGLVFNCDPGTPGVFVNPGTRRGVCGVWDVCPNGAGGFTASSYAMLPKEGNGSAGLKLVVHEGTYADYEKDHLLPSFNIYWDPFVPLRLLKFGAPKAGPGYKDGNCRFEKKFGWVGTEKRSVRTGNPTGAYYSHAYGTGKATYRFAGLHPGYYIFTCQIGNYVGAGNRFSISVNGEKLATDISVKSREARTIARTFHVENGNLDIEFDGDWLISGMGLQPLLSNEEDWYMRRGFWVTDGFEPSLAIRNSDIRPFNPATFDQTIVMPEPGKETAALYREPPKPVELVDLSKPENSWMYELRMRNVNLVAEGLSYSNEVRRQTYIAESAKLHYNAFMVHGAICRHLMAPSVLQVVDDQMRKFLADAHAKNMKFVDHIDVTLGWANDYGFRALIEQLDKVMLDVNNNLPTYLFCLENPEWKRRFYEYLRKKVADGVDGFQLDELTYWKHGCACAHCRGKFTAETGWMLPLDETDDRRKKVGDELGFRWREWQGINITNWRVGLRRFTKDLNPNLYMSNYNTYGGQVGRSCSLLESMDSARTMTMMGTEVMQQDVMRCARPLMVLARVKNIFRVAYGTPSWNWYYNSNYANECFAFAVSSMTGEIPLLTGSWLGAVYDPAFADPVEWASRSRPMKIAGAFPLAEVGLFFSCSSCRYNEGDGHTPEILGLAQELETMHVPYEFFADQSCTFEQLKNYKVVFIGDAQCLSDGSIRALRTFMSRGGRVYGRPGCGTRDELGRKREAENLDGYTIMPSAAPFYEPENPERGKGTKQWTCDPEKEKLFRREIAGFIGDATWWKVEGVPDKVYTSVFREATGDIVIHFLNATGCDQWKNGQFVLLKSRARYPALKEDMFFEVPASVGGRAIALSPDFGIEERKLDMSVTKNGLLRFRLPKDFLQVYTIVRFANNQE